MATSRTPDPLARAGFGDELDRMVHDARTPLASLLMWVRLLRGGQVQTEAAVAAVERNALSLSERLDHLQALADQLREAQRTPPRRPRVKKSSADRAVAEQKPRPRRVKRPPQTR